MASLADAFDNADERHGRQVDKTIGRFEVATVTPTFTVYMDGAAEACAAQYVPGLTYIVGTTGQYVHRQGLQPLCIPSA